ncbi:MAG: Ig-like domain-containing protein [Candidatus Caldarchaeales archaeon]
MRRALALFALVLLLTAALPSTYAPQEDRIDNLDELFEAISSRVPGFAGLHYRDGALVISLARPEPAVANVETMQLASLAEVVRLSEVAELVREGRYVVETVRYSFAQLARWRQAVLSDGRLAGIMTAIDIDEVNNRLFVGVSSPEHVETARRILSELGVPQDGYSVRHLVIEPMVGLRDRVRPVIGGLQIAFSSYLCTLGFIAIRNGVPGYVTNDHCTNVRGQVDGTNHYQPTVATNNLIGQETVDPPFFTGSPCPPGYRCRYSDAAFGALQSGVPYSLGRIARTAGLGSLNIVGEWRIVGEAWSSVAGQVLNKVGRTTGWTQGSVIQGEVYRTCADVVVSGTNILMLCQYIVSTGVGGVGPGDSGSPVFRIIDSSAGTVELHGILWGGDSAGTLFVFSPISQVEQELGSLETFQPEQPTPSITVVSPNGGETWTIGETRQIRWSSQNVAGNVDILLSRDGGTTWTVLFGNTPNDGVQDWTVTGPSTSSAKVRVRSASDPSVYDDSDNVFTIRLEGPGITVLSPNGGETWEIGTTVMITWSSSQISGTVKIEISRDGGQTWTTIVRSTPNDGSHPWRVTGPLTSNALIRITSNQNPSVSDTSDSTFSIVDTTPPSVRVVRPNGGESIRRGSTYTIRWSASDAGGVQRVEIYFSGDGGDNWQLIASLNGNPGSYGWRVEVDPTDQALIRVTVYDYAGNYASDTSDRTFRIRN